MPKHTISLEKGEMRVIKVIQAVQDISNIDKAISFIIRDYDKINSYSEFIMKKRGSK